MFKEEVLSATSSLSGNQLRKNLTAIKCHRFHQAQNSTCSVSCIVHSSGLLQILLHCTIVGAGIEDQFSKLNISSEKAKLSRTNLLANRKFPFTDWVVLVPLAARNLLPKLRRPATQLLVDCPTQLICISDILFHIYLLSTDKYKRHSRAICYPNTPLVTDQLGFTAFQSGNLVE